MDGCLVTLLWRPCTKDLFYAQGICFVIAISMSEAVFHQNPTCYWSSVLIPVNIARFKCKLSRAGTLDI